MKEFFIVNKNIIKWLVVPLIIISITLFIVKYYFHPNDEGIIVNIITEIIGIIITVLFVGYILNQNEKHNWKIAEKRIVHKIQHLVNETIALLEFTFSLESFDKPKGTFLNEKGENVCIIYAENNLLPKIDGLITNIDARTLDNLIYYLKQIDSSVNKIYNEFSGKLSPFLFAKFADLKDLLFHLIDSHRFHTEVHRIDTAKFLELYRAGHNIHNESVMTFIKNNTKTLIKIIIEIDNYLRKNFKNIDEKFPYMIEYRKTV